MSLNKKKILCIHLLETPHDEKNWSKIGPAAQNFYEFFFHARIGKINIELPKRFVTFLMVKYLNNVLLSGYDPYFMHQYKMKILYDGTFSSGHSLELNLKNAIFLSSFDKVYCTVVLNIFMPLNAVGWQKEDES